MYLVSNSFQPESVVPSAPLILSWGFGLGLNTNQSGLATSMPYFLYSDLLEVFSYLQVRDLFRSAKLLWVSLPFQDDFVIQEQLKLFKAILNTLSYYCCDDVQWWIPYASQWNSLRPHVTFNDCTVGAALLTTSASAQWHCRAAFVHVAQLHESNGFFWSSRCRSCVQPDSIGCC